jgi:hypothetical protein
MKRQQESKEEMFLTYVLVNDSYIDSDYKKTVVV